MTTRTEQDKWIRSFIGRKVSASHRGARFDTAVRFHEKVLHYDETHPIDDNPYFSTAAMAKTIGKAFALDNLTQEELERLERTHAQQPPHTLTELMPPNITRLSDFKR